MVTFVWDGVRDTFAIRRSNLTVNSAHRFYTASSIGSIAVSSRKDLTGKSAHRCAHLSSIMAIGGFWRTSLTGQSAHPLAALSPTIAICAFFSTTFCVKPRLILSLPFSLVNPLRWFVGVEGAISLGLRHPMSQRLVRYCPNRSFSGPPWTPTGRAGPTPGKSHFGRLSQTYHFSIYSLYEIGTFGLRRLWVVFGTSPGASNRRQYGGFR